MELWDIYDNNYNKSGKTILRGDEHLLKEGEFHLSVDVWIVNQNNQFLIQKRSPNKKLYPNLWEYAAGGAVISGENSYQGCIRETVEELGFVPDMANARLIHQFIRNKFMLVDVYLIRQHIEIDKIKIQEEEVSEVRWVTANEIENLIKDGLFIKSILEGYYKVLKILNIKTNQ